MKKTGWFYAAVIGAVGLFIWLLIQNGPEATAPVAAAIDAATVSKSLWDSFLHQLKHPLAILLMQIISIILTARLFGTLFRKMGQPSVIGEIVAGIALGPSLLGWAWPEATAFLFPATSLGNLQVLSQIGLLLFMFVIGMELDIRSIRNKAHEAVVISHASIIFPFALGVGTSYFLFQQFAVPGISFTAFALFMGISMSITAFPVLARIVQERGLSRTQLGNLALTCAAADDVTAWCILAAVIALVQAGGLTIALITIALSAVFIFFMFWVVKPFLARIARGRDNTETVNRPVVAIMFLTLLVSAYLSEIIGIHALFGAFLAGVIMPENFNFKKVITDKIEDVSLVVLLPLFFVFTGLRTQINTLNSIDMWLVCLGVTGVAVLGKLGGSALTARFLGQNWRDSLSIGALMNTRGLMELVVLNIGYDLGILGPEIFTMMVFMALITTFMTGPLLDLIERIWPEGRALLQTTASQNLLISFGKPAMGAKLMKLAQTFAANSDTKISALHVSPINDISPADAELFETESFTPLRAESAKMGLAVDTIYRANEDIDEEIMDVHNKLHPALLLMGGAETMFREQPMGIRIKRVLAQAECDVLLFSDHDFTAPERVAVAYYGKEDLPLLQYAHTLAQSANSVVTVLTLGNDLDILANYMANQGYFFATVPQQQFEHKLRAQYDLLLIKVGHWENILHQNPGYVDYLPSVLVLRKGKTSLDHTSWAAGHSQVA